MKASRSITLSQRFALLVALCGLAILVPAGLYTAHKWDQAQVLRREHAGVGSAQALLEVIRLAQQHRGLSAVWLGGKDDQAGARSAKAAEVAAAIKSFDAVLEIDRAQATPLGKRWQATRSDWTALAADIEARKVDGGTSSARHTILIARMIADLDMVLEHWELAFDPDPARYLLIIGALQETPRMIEISGQMRARGANLLSAADKATPMQRGAYAALADSLTANFDRASATLERAAQRGGGDAQGRTRSVAKLSDLGKSAITLARRHVVEPDTLSYSSSEFVKEMTQLIDGMYAALGALRGELHGQFERDEAAALWAIGLTAALVLALFGCAVGVSAYTGAWIRRRLGTEPDELQAAAARVAEGDLVTPVHVRSGDGASVAAAMSRMQQSLQQIVGGVRANAEQVAGASGQIAQGNQDLSSRTESQASALQQTAASMEELRTTISHSADSARQASQLASEASDAAGRGGAGVAELAATMGRIEESSRRIADIIGTIDGIAFQTNILALNAAVEAARAGEQGRGFAVVAGEVRALAQRSSDAAREIRTLITDSVERVGQGSRQGHEVAATMDDVVTRIRRVSDLITEVSAAAQQQTAGVAQVTQAVTQMDSATQQNAALVEESAAAAESLRVQAVELQCAMSSFRTVAAA